MRIPCSWRPFVGGCSPQLAAVLVLAALVASPVRGQDEENESDPEESRRSSRITDEEIPFDPSAIPVRPEPVLELGNPFLDTGPVDEGFRLPGGAVWQPSLLVFGTYRTAIQAFHDGDTTFAEWANRLDLFANLQLTGTERLLVGFRPLDEDGRFTGYRFNGPREGREDELNVKFTTLFFEGEIGELFPALDPRDEGSYDIGFAVGRQEIFYQEGMLINDDLDAIGLTRDALLPAGGSDLQVTLLYGWNEIHRDDNLEDHDAQLLGLFLGADFPRATVDADFVYVFDTEDDTEGAHWGLSAVQRVGHYNVSARWLGSQALGGETPAISTGQLLFGELSTTPAWTDDIVYLNAFVGFDEFSSAARGPATGGPLGRVGILFEAVGLGRYGAPLGNRADDSVGGSVGYQFISDTARRQATLELGGRRETIAGGRGALALGTRVQQAIGQRIILQADLFGSLQEERDDAWGSRLEMRVEF